MTARAHETALRNLARHQWVRDHGTPRASTLVGEPAVGQEIWREWLAVSGRREAEVATHVEPPDAGGHWLDETAARSLAQALERPSQPLAVMVRSESLRAWTRTRTDRAATFLQEGVVDLTAVVARDQTPAQPLAATDASPERPLVPAIAARARSVAEAVLFDALEATAATRGRFQLNQTASFSFGARAAEADLLSRADDLVIEVDGHYHFTDADRYRRDRRKDLLLQAHGFIVIRFLAEDILADPRVAVRAVTELLGLRQGRTSRSKRP